MMCPLSVPDTTNPNAYSMTLSYKIGTTLNGYAFLCPPNPVAEVYTSSSFLASTVFGYPILSLGRTGD